MVGNHAREWKVTPARSLSIVNLISSSSPLSRWLRIVLAMLASMSMWFFFDCIFVPQQVRQQNLDGAPRGNLSDLYPRWLGARELLLHGRDPYSEDIARESQTGYYGRALDPSRPADPKDREAFAYPVYVVFLLAPFVRLSFHNVQWTFHWILIALTLFSAWLWLRALRWRLPWAETIACGILLVSSLPGVQAVKLQQLTLLVAALLAACAAAIVERQLILAGVLLAFSTIKPQLAWPLVLFLFLWTLSNWRPRRNLAISFASTMALLLAGSEWLLPGWLRMFVEALRQYHQYTNNVSILDAILGLFLGRAVAIVAFGSAVWRLWSLRKHPASSSAFAHALALVMALTVLIVPMIAPYNQVLLFPAILYLAHIGFAGQPRSLRFAYPLGAVAVAFPWLMSASLAVVYLAASPAAAMADRKLPFLTTLSFPLLIFALILAQPRPQPCEAAPGTIS
jgi:Glycosyltransferase family 87